MAAAAIRLRFQPHPRVKLEKAKSNAQASWSGWPDPRACIPRMCRIGVRNNLSALKISDKMEHLYHSLGTGTTSSFVASHEVAADGRVRTRSNSIDRETNLLVEKCGG